MLSSTPLLFLLLLPIITTLIMPMTNSGEQPDMTSFTKHMLLMENMITNLQSPVLTTNSQLATVQSKLQTTEDELRNAIAELRVAETDIEDLKTKVQKHPNSDELTDLKAQVNALEAGQRAVVEEIILTVHGSLNSSVKSNTGEIQIMKSQLLETITRMNRSSQALNAIRAEYTTIQSKQHMIEQDLMGTKATVASTSTDMKVVKTQISTLSGDVTRVNQQLSVYETKTEKSFWQRQNITEYEVAECKALAQSTAADLQTVQTQVNTVSTDVHGLRGELTAIRNKTNKDVAFQVTQRGASILARINLPFDTVDLNTGNGYNKTTDMFPAPVSGTYIFWADIVFTDPVGYHTIYLRKASTILDKGVVSVIKSGSYHTASIMRTTHLDEGDQVHFTTTFTGSSIYGLGYSSYGGALLHAS